MKKAIEWIVFVLIMFAAVVVGFLMIFGDSYTFSL